MAINRYLAYRVALVGALCKFLGFRHESNVPVHSGEAGND